MDVLTILFTGLIAHVMTDAGPQRAVFVNVPMHEARLVVDPADIIDGEVFPLRGEHVTIEGLAPREVLFEASFLRHVPSLARLSGASGVIPAIESGAPHEAVSAYLDLPGGTLSAESLFAERSAFVRGGSQCIAQTVVFRAKATGAAVTLRTASGKRLRVRAGATLRVSNDPPHSTGGSHFRTYAALLRDGIPLSEPQPTGQSCTGGRRRAAPHGVAAHGTVPGCSNSAWP